ncbi:MAG: hypothetical protein MZW92_22860 [Comamonadaceae bacterium]|nr:hypothetical protein [Comamonadaceae bacterium]
MVFWDEHPGSGASSCSTGRPSAQRRPAGLSGLEPFSAPAARTLRRRRGLSSRIPASAATPRGGRRGRLRHTSRHEPTPAPPRGCGVLHLEDSERRPRAGHGAPAPRRPARCDAARVETREASSSPRWTEPWDVVLSDYNLPGFTGLEALADAARQRGGRCPSSWSRARSARTPRSRRCATAPATTC